MANKVQNKEIEKYILENYLKQSSREIAERFGFEKGVVQRFLKKKGLKIPPETLRYFRTKSRIGQTTCTPQDDAYIKSNYLTISPQRIADAIGGSETRVKTRMKQLGLVVPPEIIKQRVIDSRIKKGNTPFNKGKKQTEYMSEEAISKTKGTRFKKGTIPPNSYNEVGKVTVRKDSGGRKYLHICVEIGKWEMLHVHNWKKAGRKIPKGHSLWCINGDTTDCSVENWECISRAENLRRNALSDGSIASKLARINAGKPGNFIDKEAKELFLKHPDLLEVKRQQLLLGRSIKEAKK